VACEGRSTDSARGVHVRVLLDKRYVGRDSEAAFGYLSDHRVEVRWAPSQFDLTHDKALVIDRHLAAVVTLNLTARCYGSSRDFVLLDRRPANVAAIEATFAREWSDGFSFGPVGDLDGSPTPFTLGMLGGE
jgi:cardiolipin synthase